LRPIALPRDRVEVDLAIAGPSNALIEWTRGVRLRVAGRTLVPIVRTQRLDALGAGVLTTLTVLAAESSDVTIGSSATLIRGDLPAGITLGTVAAVRSSRTNAFARELAYAIGPAIQPIERSRVNAEFVAQAAALSVTMDAQDSLRRERFADTATELLAEWERRLRVPAASSLSVPDRRALALAAMRGAFGGPESRVLSALHAIDPTATITNGRSFTSQDAPKHVYLFAVALKQSFFDDESKRATVRRIVRQMAPAHADFGVGVNTSGFLCDHVGSRCDVDFLGA
jgi:hypothetical protein